MVNIKKMLMLTGSGYVCR